MRGATASARPNPRRSAPFQSTRPVRGATVLDQRCVGCVAISIHAPRAGRDLDIYTHVRDGQLFQSTRPVRGATLDFASIIVDHPAISIHAPRAGRDKPHILTHTGASYFNPRAPCGARLPKFWYKWTKSGFQSTRPVRGATRQSCWTMPNAAISIHAPRAGRDEPDGTYSQVRVISIHAPRAGRDELQSLSASALSNFNPRAPCGARRFAGG